MDTSQNDYVSWLVQRAVLHNVEPIAARYAGKGEMWRHPYAETQPRAAASLASVWCTTYPQSIITRNGESVLQTLGDNALWSAFAAIGIQGLHSGPMKIAGGLRGREFTPTIDGYFDRIGLKIDPAFGTEEQFITMCRHAADHGAVIIDDIIPGHTGKGPDFRLAEMAHGDYPGLYHMVEIDPADWPLLPPVAEGKDTANLTPEQVDLFQQKGYIVGQLIRTIFYEPGVKETDWSATDIVRGVDGLDRRWIYLHYFKEGQPTLNWLDPTFAAPRLVMGDALHALGTLGASMLRLDANGFLGVEQRPGQRAWSEGHPLSVTANQLIAGLVRKAGGFTFQELNLTVDDIAAMSVGGADLSYDFITRPAYHHALVTGDTAFLRLMLGIMHETGVDPASLVHGLQNHDELTLELVHFWTLHSKDSFELGSRNWTGEDLRDWIRAKMYARLTGPDASYNLKFVTNGVACTTASVVAAALGIRDLTILTSEEKARIQQAHLLLAMYNALQPGIFAISGWDLVGALPLPREAVAAMMGDGDTRWIHRGAYDLMDRNPGATLSAAGLPRAATLYSSLPEQLQRPESFASQLRRMLAVRQQYRIFESRQISIPDVRSKSLLLMLHQLPDQPNIQMTALNFGPDPVQERVTAVATHSGVAVNMLAGEPEGLIAEGGAIEVSLAGYEGKSFLLPPLLTM